MKHLIIGTAGHIDHGKTTLIRAITGRNTDRLKEEQERGISIELGFTYFDLPSGQRAGIIDVPGHEKFIKNMLAGAIGIDIVLLVVAADEGIMPQTIEHLGILDLLGTKKGIIVLSKCDLVDEDWIELIEEDIRKQTVGTFLENAQIIQVSSTKNKGIEDVINLIDSYTIDIEERDINSSPRLPVDRVFSISGFGTVVTGTLLEGQFKVGGEVQIFPSDKIARIRTLQVHDKDEEVAYGGQRVAINLAGVKKEDIGRGDVIANRASMQKTMILDVKVKLLKSIDKGIVNRTRLHLYIGTREVLCRLVILDKDELMPGEEAYAQLRLEEEIVCKRNDKFILRFYSPMYTVGGGVVLEPNAEKKKRFNQAAIEELKVKEIGDSKAILEKLIKSKSKDLPSLKEISVYASMHDESITKDIEELSKEGKIILFNVSKDVFPVHIDSFNQIKTRVEEEIKYYHDKYPLRLGISKEEIRSKVFENTKQKLADLIIQNLLDSSCIVQNKDLLSIFGYEPKYTNKQMKVKDEILSSYDYSLPKKEELSEKYQMTKEDIDELFSSLILNKDIIKISDDVFLTQESFEKALDKLRQYLIDKGSLSIGEFRDLLNTNRKVALGILEYLDQLKITKRDGERRTLI